MKRGGRRQEEGMWQGEKIKGGRAGRGEDTAQRTRRTEDEARPRIKRERYVKEGEEKAEW